MRAIVFDAGSCQLRECAVPAPGKGEVLVKVAYAGINRADLLQLKGRYPAPDAPDIPGMEISGTISECGDETGGWKTGDAVCALVTQGGFAEYVAVPAAQLLPVEKSLTLEQAGALPEGCFTVWSNLVWQGNIQPGDSVLIHGGTSGVGTVAIQMARALGATVYATAGSDEKVTLCETLGAKRGINYHSEDFVQAITEETDGRGVDIILDMVGGEYVERNLAALARGGRLLIIAFQKGAKISLNFAPVLLKQLTVRGSTLRSRSAAEKGRIASELREKLWPEFLSGTLKPVIDQVFALQDAQKALKRMDEGLNVGKMLLRI